MNDLTTTDPLYDKLDRAVLNSIKITPGGGMVIDTFGQMVEVAKLLSILDVAVPPHLRNKPRLCLAVVMQAQQWEMDARAVASQSYVVKNRDTESVAWMAQLLHAVIERKAPIKKRLDVRYEGEGETRVCIVSGTFHDEDAPREWRSPPLGVRRPKSGGSPLWTAKPDVQLFYDTSRDWCRIYCPDVLLGLYSRDEMEEFGATTNGNVQFARVVNPLADAPPPPAPPPQAAPEPPPAAAAPPAPKRARAPKAPERPSYEAGAYVQLNMPNPPLRLVREGKLYGTVQQGDVGIVEGPRDANAYAVNWTTLPGYTLLVADTDLVPATEAAIATVKEPPPAEEEPPPPAEVPEEQPSMFDPVPLPVEPDAPEPVVADEPPKLKLVDAEYYPEPYDERTSAEYSAYTRAWLDRAVAEKWPHADVIKRFAAEKELRHVLVDGWSSMAEWESLKTAYRNAVAKLQPPIT
jgi:hypothetical protein